MAALFANAHANLFTSGDFELVSGMGVLFGTYTIKDNDRYADLVTFKVFDYESEGYTHSVPQTLQTMAITREGTNGYRMDLRVPVPNGSIVDAVLHMSDSGAAPTREDLPNDPNGDGFNAQYQIEQDVWDFIFLDRGLLAGGKRFTVAHASNEPLSANGTFKVDRNKIEDSWEQGAAYYEKTGDTPDQSGQYAYAVYMRDGSTWYTVPANYAYELFDDELGIVPVPFEKMNYSATGRYYYVSLFKWTETGSSQESEVQNYRVWFENGNVQKIEYSVLGRTYTRTFTYSAYGTTTVDLPQTSGGQGSGTGESGQGTGESGQGTGESGQGTDNGTTVIAVYPDVTSAASFERLVRRGLRGTFSTSATESETYVFTYGESGNVIYFYPASDNETYFDVSAAEYYDCYVKADGVWTAARFYYEDEGSDYQNRDELVASLRSMAYGYLLLNATDAARSGMQRETGTYLGRSVDVFTVTENGLTYTYVVDQTTGLVLSNRMSISVQGVEYFTCNAATAFETGFTYTLPDVTVVDPHAGGGEELVAITDDFTADDVLATVLDPEFGGFSITYQITETLIETFSMKDDVYRTENNLKGVYTADLRDEEKAVMYEEQEDYVYASELDYEEMETSREHVLNDIVLGEFYQYALCHTYYDDAVFTKSGITYLEREAYLYQNEDTHEKYIVDAETGLCLLYQSEYNLVRCTSISFNIPDIEIPTPTPEE